MIFVIWGEFMFKYFLIFLGLFAFSGIAGAVPVNCAVGTVSGVLICAKTAAVSSVSLVGTGLIAIAAVMMGVYLIIASINK